ncbi:MAG: hypothetical protein ABI067_12505, partial [Leifsonia sp.]
MNNQRPRRALVVCFSNLETDPRVTRQIEWLSSDGWQVDSLGLGPKPTPSVHRHYAMSAVPAFVRPSAARALIHTLLPYSWRFGLLQATRIPKQLYSESS